jgi:hypothetical protein
MPRSHAALTPGRRGLLACLFVAAALWAAGGAARLPVAMALATLAPGYLVERLLPRPRPHPLARLALWTGLGLSLTPLLYQWLWVFRLPLDDGPLGVLAALLALGALLAAWRDLGPRTRDAEGGPSGEAAIFWLLLGLITALTVWTRFSQIRDLALPAWVDSVHHALLVRVAVESRGVPTALAPYMPVSDLPYHWGYHVIAATLLRLSGLGLPETLLWSGQILNALHAPLAGALALALWRRPGAAIGAALVAGLISTMPAYYVSWGRYTQLTGLLLIPGLAVAWSRGLAGGRGGPWHLAAAAVLLAGLSLIHVRVLAFALALLAALTLVWAAGSSWPALRARAVDILGAGLVAAALGGPWLAALVRRALLPAVARPGGLVLEGGYDALNLAILWVGYNQLLAALAMAALLLGLRARRAAAATIPLWVAALLVLANPRLLGYALPLAGAVLLARGLLGRAPAPALAGAACIAAGVALARVPSTWLINNDAVVISLFLPLGAAIGGGAELLYAAAAGARSPRLRRAAAPAAVALTAAVALWGAWQLRDVVNEGTVLATPADRAAVEWAAANTPPDARFLINAAPWLGAAGRATDGGWWLLPLAGRWTSTPPVIFAYGPVDYVNATVERTRVVENYRPGDEQAILDLIRRDGIGYLYFGPKPGPLRAETFEALPGFRVVYRQDGVTILAVDPRS